jgi:3-hydroxyacyl-CoA dehydrogenase
MIRTVAVLGAGTMGAQIAAHFANIGVDVWLLDLSPSVAREGLDRARKLKPDPFFTPDAIRHIRTDGFDQGLSRLAECDWIIEAIVERLDTKQALLARVDQVRRKGSIVTTNTSGLSVEAIAAGRSPDFRSHWLGTHFFNPPRYLHLLELIPTPETDPAVVDMVRHYADHRLGKGVVIAKDTPNFIANHIGLHGLVRILNVLSTGQYSIEEIDAITGPIIGRPRSATFRTLDIAGLDVLAHVIRNLTDRLEDEQARQAFALPALVHDMLARGWVGEKSKQGFYKRVEGADGQSQILVLDPATFEYRPSRHVNLPALEAARSIEDLPARLRLLFGGKDRVGEFLRETLAPTIIYAASVAPDIAFSLDDVDRVMRWGFGWDLGPFEVMDVIGVPQVVTAAGSAAKVPRTIAAVLDAGASSLRDGPVPVEGPGLEILRSAKASLGVVRSNAGASLVDLSDGVLAVEFHSKMNAIGGDAIEMIHEGLREAGRNFRGLVIGNEAPNFSAGANLMLVLLEAQEGNWEEIDLMVRAFQGATMAIKHADVPVVVAPVGLALGGGCEIALHGDRVQAAAETYLGLVEVGVGLIPAGGGTKEMLLRSLESRPSAQSDLLPLVQRAFETIAFGKVSASGPDAVRLGYLRSTDAFTMNRDRLVADAKARALARVAEGYQPPEIRTSIPVGGDGVLAALTLGVHLAWRAGRISDFDALIGRKLAWVLAGGTLPHATTVSEQHVLDLEREAFLSLCGESKTQERIAYTLKSGKTLRN